MMRDNSTTLKISEFTDFMMASVVPLSYASLTNERIFSKFLKELRREKSDLASRFDSIINDFNALPEIRLPILNEIDDLEEKKSNTIDFLRLEDPNDSWKTAPNYNPAKQATFFKNAINALKNNRDLLPEEKLALYNDKINRLATARNMLSYNYSQTQQARGTESPARLFIDSIQSFTLSLNLGAEAVEQFLDDTPEIKKSFKKPNVISVFHDTTTVFIKFIVKNNLPLKNHPLPIYLCPFNPSNEDLVQTLNRSWDATWIIENNEIKWEMKHVRARIEQIQKELAKTPSPSITGNPATLLSNPTATKRTLEKPNCTVESSEKHHKPS